MLSNMFAFLAIMVLLGVVYYDRRTRTRWEAAHNGFWMQRRTSKNRAHFVFRTSQDVEPTSLVPAIWEIKHPFSNKPKYTTQHEGQLQAWWKPLAIQFAGLGRDPKAIKFIRFTPTLGIYVQMDVSKKTKRIPEEETVLLMLEEALKTWKPRRFDIDSSFEIRKSLYDNWQWLAAVPMGVVLQGAMHYRYIDFLSDSYYIALGIPMALLGAAATVLWYYPKMAGSVHRSRTTAHIAGAVALALALTLPYGLIWLNMLHTRTICEMPVPVTEWYSRSGKTRTYFAVLDLRQCSGAIPEKESVRVGGVQYEQGSTMNIRVSKGILGRYFLEKQ